MNCCMFCHDPVRDGDDWCDACEDSGAWRASGGEIDDTDECGDGIGDVGLAVRVHGVARFA